jgi:hypothetical protein
VTLSLHDAASDLAYDVALARPTSQREGLFAYVDKRKARVRAGLVSADDLECTKIDRATKALDILARMFGRDLGDTSAYEWPTVPANGRPWERRAQVARHQAAMANLLTPAGWRTDIGATLEGLLRAEEKAVLEHKAEERQLHQAVLFEIRLLLKTLDDVERKGVAASRSLAHQIGMGNPGPMSSTRIGDAERTM